MNILISIKTVVFNIIYPNSYEYLPLKITQLIDNYTINKYYRWNVLGWLLYMKIYGIRWGSFAKLGIQPHAVWVVTEG